MPRIILPADLSCLALPDLDRGLCEARTHQTFPRGKGRQVPRMAPKADFSDNNITRTATVKSWDNQFVGDIASVLHSVLRHYMKVQSLYCHVVPHVQSSGTGKSRTHDELAIGYGEKLPPTFLTCK